MTILGIGTDICEISRIEKLLTEKGDKFIQRILTITEQQNTITPSHLAKRYAAKEACAKALGCGIGKSLSFHDIEITNLASGKPVLTVKNKLEISFYLSMSDEKDYAIAFVLAETE